jgi:hypothetical protein
MMGESKGEVVRTMGVAATANRARDKRGRNQNHDTALQTHSQADKTSRKSIEYIWSIATRTTIRDD